MIVEELLRQIPNGSVRFIHKDEDPRDYRVNFQKIKQERLVSFDFSFRQLLSLLCLWVS